MLGTICTDILTAIAKHDESTLLIVETGTVFQTRLEPGELDLRERSTVAIARWIKNNSQHPEDIKFLSIDLDRNHILISGKVLDDEGLYSFVKLCSGKGADVLRAIRTPID